MKRFLIGALSLVLALILIVGCAPTDVPINDEADNNTSPDDNTSPEAVGTTLNGADISEYTIVYSSTDPDYTKRAAEYIQDQIKTRTGARLFVKSDRNAQTGREIVVGETSREISTALNAGTQYTQFSMLADDDQIALEGDYFVIAAAAYYFVETYITGANFNSNVPKEQKILDPIVKKSDNYILLIGDGMGVYQTKLFDYYSSDLIPSLFSDGETQFYGYMLESQGLCRTNSLSGTTDSAAAATALATGYKTTNKYIGKDEFLRDVTSITELAGSLGKKTAVMSTEVSTGATPAGFSAHANNRSDSDIILATQSVLKSRYGTIIECGYNYYSYSEMILIENKINKTLSSLSTSENGFFLMYEEAYIDKHCHDNDAEDAFLALVRFNQAIGIFMEYAFYHPNTMVIITADHETGKLLPNSNGGLSFGSGDHSNADVPVFAYGYYADLFAGKTIENVQIPKTIASIWGIKDFGNPFDIYGPLV